MIDEEKAREEERFDGLWMLRTSTDFPAEEVALKYKQLWMVESIFRSVKSMLKTGPVYHKYDATIRGHVFAVFWTWFWPRSSNHNWRQRIISLSGKIC